MRKDILATCQIERADAAVIIGAERIRVAEAINATAECPSARVHNARQPRRHRLVRRVPMRVGAHVGAGPLVFAVSLFARVTRQVA